MTRKLKLISKFIKSQYQLQIGKQTIATQIFPNISRSKGNQASKFGQLIEYNMGNIFLAIICTTKFGGKLVPDGFLEIEIKHISGSTI